jgi:putative flippase GtrA
VILRRSLRGVARRQFARFLLVGTLNTSLGYLLFGAFVQTGWSQETALLFAMIIAVLAGFATNARLVFGNTDWRRMGWFVAAYAVFYWMNVGLLHLLASQGLEPLLAQALCLPVMTPLSFFVNKFLVFGSRTAWPRG